MTLRLTIYIFVLVVFLFGQRHYGILSRVGLSKGSHVVVLLFFLYLLLLLWEVVSNYGSKMSLSKAKKRGFFFSFLIGGLWGLAGTYSAGFYYDVSYILFAVNYFVAGLFFGVFSLAVTTIIFHRLAK